MIQNFALRETVLSDGVVVVRPTHTGDEATLATWFADPDAYGAWSDEPMSREDAAVRCDIRNVAGMTTWPFIIMRDHAAAGLMQVWHKRDGSGALDLFIVPEHRRKGFAMRALSMVAAHLRDVQGWKRITVDPHVDNDVAIACFEKAGFLDTGERQDDITHVHQIMEFR